MKNVLTTAAKTVAIGSFAFVGIVVGGMLTESHVNNAKGGE